MNGFNRCNLPAVFLLTSLCGILIAGCASDSYAPPATSKPPVKTATDIDLATTQPTYWFDKPGVANVTYHNFDRLWDTCEETLRSYQFELDRKDFRLGLVTSKPMISKEILEPWRRDAGDLHSVLANSLSTMSRTVRISIAKDSAGTFVAVPKVMVQRLTLLERRITSTAQYRTAFSGPLSVEHDDNNHLEIPVSYWSPVGRDYELEIHLATEIRDRLREK